MNRMPYPHSISSATISQGYDMIPCTRAAPYGEQPDGSVTIASEEGEAMDMK